MWYGLRAPSFSHVNPDLAAAVSELLQSTLRSLIYATLGACAAIYILANVLEAGAMLPGVTIALLPVVVCSVLALRMASEQVRATLVTWLVGGTASITLALHLFKDPALSFFYLLLPLFATVYMFLPAGALAGVGVLALAWGLSRSSLFPAISEAHLLVLLIGGTLNVGLGWALTHSLLTATEWSLSSFRQARRELEEARNQRLEFTQIQEDLLHANRELTRLSDRLEAMYLVAEDARRVKEEFVANVSHELRTPLNMIIGFSEMITQSPHTYGAELPPALLADITAIQRNSQHLAKLVDDVLSLSQIEAGRMSLAREWTSPQEIIEEAVTAVSALYRSKQLYLEVNVPPGLPKIFCDSTRIRQVVLNLLSNAGRFTDRGGVRIRAWQDDGGIVIGVSDSGPGIDPENQKKLFEPFQQLDGSIRRRHGGSGLGLSISKNFVEMHGGRLWVESEVGTGTTVFCRLPVGMSASAEPVPADRGFLRWFSEYGQYEARTREFKAPTAQVVPRFVVLGSGDGLAGLIRRYADGVEVASAHTIEQAVQELQRSPAWTLIVNASPFADLAPLRSQLAALPFQVPIITCWVPEKDEAARQLGVIRYLVKPVTRDRLLSTMEALGEEVKSVLLVDDQPEALQLFARMLSSARQGYRLLQATSGERALRLLRERRPDALLLDLIMPGMDGFQLLQEKAQDAAIKNIPVVVISSRDPSGTPIITDTLTVTRGRGLSMRDLLACIQAISRILTPTLQSAGPESPGSPAGRPAS